MAIPVRKYQPCKPKLLHPNLQVSAAANAINENPANQPGSRVIALLGGFSVLPPQHLALLTSKYWGAGGKVITVGFLDNPSQAVQAKIVKFANLWAKTANVLFTPSNTDPMVRVARDEDGYWSYLGTDIMSVPKNEKTMNLAEFTDASPDEDYYRVVCHEFGHVLGFPHEHTRKEIIALIDKQKALAYFETTQGWSQQMVMDQVLTPLPDSEIIATPAAEQISIMTYGFPGDITINGEPIPGGQQISAMDAAFAGKVYPLPAPVVPVSPPDPPPVIPTTPSTPTAGDFSVVLGAQHLDIAAGNYVLTLSGAKR